MSTTPKIKIEMTPTWESAFRKQFMKAQENMKHAFGLDLKDVMKRKVTRRNAMMTASDHLYGEPPKKTRAILCGKMVKKLREEMKSIGPCIIPGIIRPSIVFIDSYASFEVKGSDDYFPNLPALEQVKESLIKMGQCGLNAAEAGRSLRVSLDLLKKVNTEKDDNNVSYGKRQAQHWAHKYSHKIRRKL